MKLQCSYKESFAAIDPSIDQTPQRKNARDVARALYNYQKYFQIQLNAWRIVASYGPCASQLSYAQPHGRRGLQTRLCAIEGAAPRRSP